MNSLFDKVVHKIRLPLSSLEKKTKNLRSTEISDVSYFTGSPDEQNNTDFLKGVFPS